MMLKSIDAIKGYSSNSNPNVVSFRVLDLLLLCLSETY